MTGTAGPTNRLLAVLIAAGLMLPAPGPAVAEPAPPMRTGPDGERRVADLLSRMTLAEKIGQLNLVANNPDFRLAEVEAGRIGAAMAFTQGRTIAPLQEAARRSRHGIGLLVGLDVLHGLRTMYPLPLAETGSFDPDLARTVAESAGRAAAAIGINWTFAPMADLSRDPRWGRMIEGFGEDPLLGRVFTRARVEGFRAGGLATSLKHFAGYGAARGGRDYDAAEIGPGDLRDSFLPPFRAGIEAGAETVMSAFHALNGVPASGDPALLTGILRGELGFRGFVVSDWYAVAQLADHGIVRDGADAARTALGAGIDMDMASGLYARHLAAEVGAGRADEAAVTQAARRVLTVKAAMGLLDAAVPPLLAEAPPPTSEERSLARRAAQDTIVLLRNDGTLPLRPGRHIAVIGGAAADPKAIVGPHGALVRWEDGVSVLAGLRRRAELAGSPVQAAAGCDVDCGSDAGFDEAVRVAAAADVVVAALGESLDLTGEAGSRAYLTLPGRQAALLERLVATGKPVVLVLAAGRPIELGPVGERLAALVMAWYPGTEGGTALADLLFGDVPPSAKLAISWPRTVGQVPNPYDRLPSGRPPDPGNRFTLRYVDEETSPLFPFGFGLSYTRFALEQARIDTPTVRRDGRLQVSVDLRNVGERAGREVVQLYTRQPVASVSRPLRRLGAFAKVALEPGETRRVTLTMPVGDLGFRGPDGALRLEPGSFQVFVGTDATAPLVGEVVLPD